MLVRCGLHQNTELEPPTLSFFGQEVAASRDFLSSDDTAIEGVRPLEEGYP